jgi:hypothetical protein
MAKSSEKLSYIEKYITKLNKRLKNRSFKAEFVNEGSNRYCLKLKDQIYKFNTYDDVINCLLFIDYMFEEANKEIGGK